MDEEKTTEPTRPPEEPESSLEPPEVKEVSLQGLDERVTRLEHQHTGTNTPEPEEQEAKPVREESSLEVKTEAVPPQTDPKEAKDETQATPLHHRRSLTFLKRRTRKTKHLRLK